MITLQPQLEPSATLGWKFYSQPATVDWLHTEQRYLQVEDQIAPSRGPVTVIPSAVFTISAYVWDEVEW